MNNKPDLVRITVEGPTGWGKTALLARLEKVLKDEFGVDYVVSKDLMQERAKGDPDNPYAWESPRQYSVVVLEEECK